MFIGSTLGRIAVTRARAEAVIEGAATERSGGSCDGLLRRKEHSSLLERRAFLTSSRKKKLWVHGRVAKRAHGAGKEREPGHSATKL